MSIPHTGSHIDHCIFARRAQEKEETMSVDFSECIIIPLNVYKQRCIKDPDPDLDLLYDPCIPSNQKMKPYAHNVKMRAPWSKYPKVEIINPAERNVSTLQMDVDSILQDISTKNRPFANSILTKILQHPGLISWNEKFEVSINQKIVPDSNIIQLLKYALGEKITLLPDSMFPKEGDSFMIFCLKLTFLQLG